MDLSKVALGPGKEKLEDRELHLFRGVAQGGGPRKNPSCKGQATFARVQVDSSHGGTKDAGSRL